MDQALGDQQYAICTRGAGFQNLIWIDDEIFSQHGQRYCPPHCDQKIEMALKVFFVGEDAQAVCPVLFIDASNFNRIKIGPNQPGGGGRLLDLGDQSQMRCG